MTEKEYRQHPAISRSELWHISESPEKFRYYKDNPPEPTQALLFGQVFHKLALQPESFDDEFVIAPSVDRRTKAGKEAWEKFTGGAGERTVIDSDMYSQAMQMCKSLYAAPFVPKLIAGEKEKPFFWTDELTGEECKCRTDCLTLMKDRLLVVDVKSANDAGTDAFMRDAVRFGYDFQAAMYCEGVEKNTGIKPQFVFIVVEKQPPYAVNVLQADDVLVRRGGDIFRELIGIYHDCRQTGEWYGYLGKYKMINNLSLPAWLAKEIE